MQWWISAGTSSVLFVIAGWLVRQLLVTRLTKSVESEFNLILERYRTELRTSEERFKAELRAKEIDISALRSSAISSVANRQTKLYDRKLQAVDDIWNAIVELAPAKFVSSLMAAINFEEMAEAAKTDPRIREVIGTFEKSIDPNIFQHKISPEKSRPFVSPMLSASYSAYRAIVSQAVMRAYAIKGGLGATDFSDKKKMAELLKSVLPHRSEYVDQYGPGAYHFLVEEIESKIIEEIHLTISDVDSDEASIKQAAKILDMSNSLFADASKGLNSASNP